jgi:CHAD domain-containing protein
MLKRHPPADPRTPFITHLSALIGSRYQRMMEHSGGTLTGDPEALHDMRVGSRRLRSMLLNGRGIYRRKRRYRRLERTIERCTIALGTVRDLDVLTDYLASDVSAAPLSDRPYLDRLRAHLGGRREERRILMHETLADLSRPKLVERFRRFFSREAHAGER